MQKLWTFAAEIVDIFQNRGIFQQKKHLESRRSQKYKKNSQTLYLKALRAHFNQEWCG